MQSDSGIRTRFQFPKGFLPSSPHSPSLRSGSGQAPSGSLGTGSRLLPRRNDNEMRCISLSVGHGWRPPACVGCADVVDPCDSVDCVGCVACANEAHALEFATRLPPSNANVHAMGRDSRMGPDAFDAFGRRQQKVR